MLSFFLREMLSKLARNQALRHLQPPCTWLTYSLIAVLFFFDGHRSLIGARDGVDARQI